MDIGAAGHFVLAEIRDDELLAVEFVGALHAGGEHRMTLGGVAADDDDEAGLRDVCDGTGIAAVAHGAEQPGGGGRLAIARTIIDVIRADDGAREFLHQIAFLVRAFRRRDEGEGIRAVVVADAFEIAFDGVERFVPRRPGRSSPSRRMKGAS